MDGLFQGEYYSVFKGRGIEFTEVREYLPGDDVRTIDWNVTAKMGKPFVKEFVEERDLTIYLLFDVSASGDFSSTTKSKRETGTQIGACIAFSAIRNNDQVGLALVSGGIEKYIPPKKGKRHVLRLIKEMLSYSPENRTTDLLAAIAALSRIKKRGIVFIISDFIVDDLKAMEFPLKSGTGMRSLPSIYLIKENRISLTLDGYGWKTARLASR